METVSVVDVREVLDQWIAGELTASEVHAWAESRYLSEDWEPESEAVNFVLSELDRLDMNLLTLEAAPIFLKALQGPDTKRVIGNHYASIDIEARRRALASDPLVCAILQGGRMTPSRVLQPKVGVSRSGRMPSNRSFDADTELASFSLTLLPNGESARWLRQSDR